MTRAALVLAVVLALARGAAADPVTVRFSTTLPLFAPVAKDVLIPWFKEVESDSGGTIAFQQFWGGQLVANQPREWDALMNHVFDIGALVPAFYLQALPDSSIFALPGVVRSAEEAAVGGWKMNDANLLRGMDKLYVIATFSNDPGGLHFARPIASLAAVKGLKIRVSGPAEAQIVEALGAAPVGMNVSDMAEALSRGVYDGSLNGWSANHLFRVTPVLKAHFDLSLGVRQFVFGMNRQAYDALPEAAKAALAKHSGLALSLRMAHAMEQDGERERAEAKDKGMIVGLSAADETRLNGVYKPLIDTWIAAQPEGAKKFAFLDATLADYRKGH
ncbi:MAG TPA: TRAP transporter substrate-binding protein DctP [Stellaceae bacterium]|nr:TRAP transporter substrate-binding protein DctP [Stellaceae bacterium]